MENRVLFINDQQVRELLSQRDVIDAVENTFKSLGKGRVKHPRKEPLWLDDHYDNMLLAMPGWLMDKHVAGVKWVSMFFNQKQGYPASSGNLIVLNHDDTGVPYALVEATSITSMRTGGGHAVIAAKYLAKKNPKTLAVIGCGAQGESVLSGFLTEFNLDEVRICDLSDDFMDNCEKKFGDLTKIQKCKSIGSAVSGCDIVVLATTSKRVLVTSDMAEPGMTIIGLNAFYDLDPEFSSGRYKWFLGNSHSDDAQIIEDPGLSAFKLSMDNVSGDLGQVTAGKCPGRQSQEEIIIYTHMGMGSLDLACADMAFHRAVEKKLGQELVFKG